MLKTKISRFGITLSAFWVFIGGFFIYYSQTENYRMMVWNAKDFCPKYWKYRFSSLEDCLSQKLSRADDFIPWDSIIIQISGGLLLIWLIVFSLKWINRAS